MTQKTSPQLTAIYLAVKDMDRAVRFYEKILGKENIKRIGWLGEEIRLQLVSG